MGSITRTSLRSARSWGRVAAVAMIDALALTSVPLLVSTGSWLLLGFLGAATLALNWFYLVPNAAAGRWIFPGLVFMSLFVLWPITATRFGRRIRDS